MLKQADRTHGIRDMVQREAPHLTVNIPPTDNRRLNISRSGRRYLSKAARKYINDHSQLRFRIPKPPIIMFFRVFWPDRRKHDAQNLIKILCDALYKEDRYVTPWPSPVNFYDRGNPRVEIWFIPVEDTSWADDS